MGMDKQEVCTCITIPITTLNTKLKSHNPLLVQGDHWHLHGFHGINSDIIYRSILVAVMARERYGINASGYSPYHISSIPSGKRVKCIGAIEYRNKRRSAKWQHLP